MTSAETRSYISPTHPYRMQDLAPFFRSIVEQDPMPVVVCDLTHTIVYMNPAAVDHYSDRGGANLVGLIIFDCHHPKSSEAIRRVFEWFLADKKNNCVHTMYLEAQQKDIYMVALRDENGELIGYYEKHESRKWDKSKFYAMD